MTEGGLFQLGAFTLHSGEQVDWKICEEALSNDEIATLAFMLTQRGLPAFTAVEGVPRGGLRLAKAMERYRSHWGGLLICDDVWTTGQSLRAQRGDRHDAHGVVLFARRYPDEWVTPLFVMPAA